MRRFREVMGSQLLTSPRVCQNSCRVDELSCLLPEMSPSWRHNRRCRDPGKGGVGCTSTCPRCAPKASGRKEASYCSILDRLQAKSSHVPLPFPLPFSHFVAVSTRVELPRRREVSNDLTEHSRFRSQALMWAFMIVAACLSHILFFLEDKTPCSCRPGQDVNGIACRSGVIVFFLRFAS